MSRIGFDASRLSLTSTLSFPSGFKSLRRTLRRLIKSKLSHHLCFLIPSQKLILVFLLDPISMEQGFVFLPFYLFSTHP